MYFYSALCYFITIMSSTTSHVVLSANTEDLRKLAKEFGSDNAVFNIYEVIKDLIGGNKNNKPNIQTFFRGEPAVTEKIEQKTEESTSKNNKKYYDVNLNDLVEQVKQKLQKDITRITADGEIKTIQETNEKLNKLISSSDTLDIQEDNQITRIKLTEDYNENAGVQNKAIENEFRNNEAYNQLIDQKISQPSIYILDENKSELKPKYDDLAVIPRVETIHRSHEHKTNIKRKRKEPERFTINEKNPGILQGFNMIPKNKRSKDYINQIEEDDYAKIKAPKTAQQNPYIQIKQPLNQQNPMDDHNYEEKSTIYNEKKSDINTNKLRPKYRNKENEFKQRFSNEELQNDSSSTESENIEQKIQPYAEQIQELVLNEVEPVTETGKDRDDKISLNIYPTPQDVTTNEGNEYETTQQLQDKIVSKSDFEMPVNVENYNLNGLIPEEDWVQDNFENV